MSRYTMATAAPQRKSRMDGKNSFIPKPKTSRQGSYDRLSETGWKPNRPRSLEPPRAGVPVGRQSREPSATKLPAPSSQRSRSAQQSEGWLMTPLNNKPKYSRTTTTPMRTPSQDRFGRSWQNSVERAIAFITVKDKRQTSDAKWQKMTAMRVNEELERRRCDSGVASGPILMKPLTITRFVDIVVSLLSCLKKRPSLDSTNYVMKLPHITKRILYPGVVSKSWLKTVNTLHTYPSALALIAYVLDLVLRVESPVDVEVVYTERDDVGKLAREYVLEEWICFNQGLNEEKVAEDYLQKLRQLLGNDEEKIAKLKEDIQASRQELEDPSEQAAKADEQRRVDSVNQLIETLKELKSKRILDSGHMDAACNKQTSLIEATHELQAENERIQQELQKLKQEVAEQPLSTADRADLLDKVDYSNRVIESKKDLVEQVRKMLQKTEIELAHSQKECLNVCVEYNQRIISLTSSHADCAGLAVEERDLMKSSTVEVVESSASSLRTKYANLADALKEAERSKVASARRLSEQNYQLDQVNAKLSEGLKRIEELKCEIRAEREASALEKERAASEDAELRARTDHLNKMAAELARKEEEFAHCQEEDKMWRKNLQEMRDYVSEQRTKVARKLDECKEKRAAMLMSNIKFWNQRMNQINEQYKK